MKKNFIDFNPFFLKILNLNLILEFLKLNFKNIIFSNSLSFEDILLLKIINFKKLNLKIFFLNTGKIFLNFLNFINKLFFWNLFNDINIYLPNIFLINNYIKKFNLNSFYNNIILRKLCCYIRKIETYNKLIHGNNILITGQRKNRISDFLKINFDFNRNIIKYNLFFNWDYKDIFYFFEKFNIPINYMYNYGYPSVGCSSCTKKVNFKNHIRTGRWWWENNFKKECGLHI